MSNPSTGGSSSRRLPLPNVGSFLGGLASATTIILGIVAIYPAIHQTSAHHAIEFALYRDGSQGFSVRYPDDWEVSAATIGQATPTAGPDTPTPAPTASAVTNSAPVVSGVVSAVPGITHVPIQLLEDGTYFKTPDLRVVTAVFIGRRDPTPGEVGEILQRLATSVNGFHVGATTTGDTTIGSTTWHTLGATLTIGTTYEEIVLYYRGYEYTTYYFLRVSPTSTLPEDSAQFFMPMLQSFTAFG